jgi:hypothetical protein
MSQQLDEQRKPQSKVIRYNNPSGQDSSPERLTFGGNEGYLPPMNERIAKIETRLDGVDDTLSEIKSDMREIRNDLRALPRWIIGTAIGSLIGMAAVVVALSALLSTWFQDSLGQTREELRNSLAQTTEELRRTIDRQWEMTQKALEKSSDAVIQTEALKLATEWQKQKP